MHLDKYHQIWTKIDLKKLGRISCEEFGLLVKEFGAKDAE